MSRIDWQAYLDGSLSPEEMAVAEQRLQTDPQAQKELAGLRSFIAGVRSAVHAEEVPLKRLEALMPASAAPRRSWPLYVTTLAAACLMAVYLLRQPEPEVVSDNANLTSDPVVAANWVQPKMPFKVPAIDLGANRPLVRTHYGSHWCCFDYKVDGQVYHLNVLKKPNGPPHGKEVKLPNGILAYVTRGIRWTQGNIGFFLVGPNEKTALEIAAAASAQLGKA